MSLETLLGVCENHTFLEDTTPEPGDWVFPEQVQDTGWTKLSEAL